MRTKTKKLAALVMSGVMTLSIAAPVAVQADDKVELTGMVQQSRWYSGLQNMVEKLEEDENISIEFEVVPDDQYDNLMKMRLNSHEAPDLIAYQFADLYAAVDPEEFFVPLDDEEWMAKVKAPEITEYNGKHTDQQTDMRSDQELHENLISFSSGYHTGHQEQLQIR